MSDKNDNVNHPSHYCDGRKYEPVDVILDWDLDYLLGNAVKYISRCERKGTADDAIVDLEKAVWYIQKRIAIMRSCSGTVEPPRDDQDHDWYDRVNTTTPSTINPMPSITCDAVEPTPAPNDASLFVMESSGETRLRAI